MIEKRSHLDIKAASRLTGLSLYTIRSWESRYQAVVPSRTKTGRRQYRYEDINKLKILQRLVTSGFRIGTIAELNLNDLETIHSANTNQYQPQNINLSAEIHHLRKLVSDFDMHPFYKSLQRIRELLPAQDFIFNILIPLMQDMGNSRKIGSLSLEQRYTFSLLIREQIHHLHANTGHINDSILGKKKSLYVHPTLLSTNLAFC